MTQAVAIISTSDLSIMADAMAKGGLFGFKNKEQAFSLMLIAQAQGQHPATVVQDYHIFSTGKAGLKADTVLARFMDQGGTIKWLDTSDTLCRIEFTHPQSGTREFSWTIEEAKRANLLSKEVWKQYPSDMLRARCIFRGVRAMCPKVFGGMYGREEVEDMQPENKPEAGDFKVLSHETVDLRAKYEGLFSSAHTKEKFSEMGALMAADGIGKEKDDALTGFDASETWKSMRMRHWARIKVGAAAAETFIVRCGECQDGPGVERLRTEADTNPLISDRQDCLDALAAKEKEMGLGGGSDSDQGLPE